jgi:hypothetical protein
MEENKDKKNTKRSVKPAPLKASALDHGRVPPQAVELE